LRARLDRLAAGGARVIVAQEFVSLVASHAHQDLLLSEVVAMVIVDERGAACAETALQEIRLVGEIRPRGRDLLLHLAKVFRVAREERSPVCGSAESDSQALGHLLGDGVARQCVLLQARGVELAAVGLLDRDARLVGERIERLAAGRVVVGHHDGAVDIVHVVFHAELVQADAGIPSTQYHGGSRRPRVVAVEAAVVHAASLTRFVRL